MMSGAVKKLGLLLKTHTKFPVVSVLKMQGTISAQRGMIDDTYVSPALHDTEM